MSKKCTECFGSGYCDYSGDMQYCRCKEGREKSVKFEGKYTQKIGTGTGENDKQND